MIRFVACMVVFLGLAACGDQTPSIEGKWAWFEMENCEADLDTIEFTGTEFFHRRQGEVAVHGTDLAYQVSDAEEGARTTAIYRFNDRTLTLTFDANGDDVLIFRGSTINGESPAAVARVMGRELYRCE